MLSDEDLKEIEDRCNAATSGPWVAAPCEWDDVLVTVAGPNGNLFGDQCIGMAKNQEDLATAVFIAACRTDVPRLVEEVRRLRAALQLICHPGLATADEAQTIAHKALEGSK